MKFGELHSVNKTFLGVGVGVMDWRGILSVATCHIAHSGWHR